MSVKCPYCDKEIQNGGALKTHIRMIHTQKAEKSPPLPPSAFTYTPIEPRRASNFSDWHEDQARSKEAEIRERRAELELLKINAEKERFLKERIRQIETKQETPKPEPQKKLGFCYECGEEKDKNLLSKCEDCGRWFCVLHSGKDWHDCEEFEEERDDEE